MVRFIAVESLLLGCLLFLAGYVFWESAGGGSSGATSWLHRLESGRPGTGGSAIFAAAVAGICAVPIILYWFLQWRGMTGGSFWMVTLAVLLLQAPAVLAHNQLNWLSFWRGPSPPPELSLAAAGGLFLLSLALLAALHRAAEIRRLRARLGTLHLESGEQRQVIAGEVVTLAGLVGLSLVITAALLSVGVALAQLDNLMVRSPWTVLTFGAAALFLMAGSLYLLLRVRQGE